MSFVYNNEVIDLLLKKSLGSAYTSSALVPGQENQILPKILNQQLLASPITNKTTSAFTWSASSNVAGGGTVKSLSNVAGETEPTSFTYIKKYENIPMTAVAGTNYRAWKPSNADMISKLENTIIGKSSFPFTLTTNINNYNTIYNTNSSFKPVISNGVLLFLGNISPDSSSTISFTEVHIYEGEFGAKSELELNELTNVNVPTPSNGELLQWDAANSKWIAGAAASSAIANANIEALNNVNVSHATTNQDDSLIYDKANSQWVAGTPVTTLEGLSDTTITTPSDKQSLVYNATNTKWENANLTTTNITDINLTSVSNGQALVYDSGTSKFINGLPTMSINNMSDVNISTPAAKNALIYDTATQKWINGLPLLNVNDINDVNTSGLIDGQVLVYNNNTQKWVPGSASASSVSGVYLRDLQDVDMTNIAQVVPDWTQSHKLAATTGEDNENLGKSVSTIGTWTAVGAPYKDGTFPDVNIGRVFLFKAGTQTQVIDSPTGHENDNYGYSLFLTASFLVVGSPRYDNASPQVLNSGALLIYNYNSGTELYATTANQTLIGTAHSFLGYSIDTNGTWMISGAPENFDGQDVNNALKGKAYIYKLDGTWSQKKILTADDGSNGDKFGTAVAINNDYAFVGCETKTSYTGGVYIYKRTSDTVWDALHIVRTKTLATGDYFGQSISVGGDFLMVGCPKGEYGGTADSTKAGEVFVYKKQSDGNWGDLSGNLGVGDFTQIGQDIDGEATEDESGTVSLSGDGTIVAIGAAENDGNGNTSGHVRVYQYNGTDTWIQLGEDIDGEGSNSQCGASVSINNDGTIVAIGAFDPQRGQVRIYQWRQFIQADENNATYHYTTLVQDTNQTKSIIMTANRTTPPVVGQYYWTQLGSDINGAYGDYAYFVQLSSNGTVAAINAYGNNDNGHQTGEVKVFQYANDTWTQIGQDINGVTTDNVGEISRISLSGDGTILATGSSGADSNGVEDVGRVRVYQYNSNNTTWEQRGQTISGENIYDSSGKSVSLSSDGMIIAIGAPGGDSGNPGTVRVYEYNGTDTWIQLGEDIVGEAPYDNAGGWVSLSSNGTIVAIGAEYNIGNTGVAESEAGHVRVYQYNGTSWTQVGQDIDGEAVEDTFGNKLSLSSDGTRLAVGAPYNDGGGGTDSGHVRVYQMQVDPTTGYYENSILTATDTAVNDHFGCSVDITTQFGIIGARTQGSSSYLKAGAAYMISNTGEGYWDHTKKITASDLAIGDEFGISVSIYDRYASIGAWKEEDTGEVDQGSAYLFSLGSPGSNDQYTLVYNSDTGRWSIGLVSGGGGSGLESIIGTQAMINANTPTGAQLFWDATNQTWTTDTLTTLPTGAPSQSTPSAEPTWNTSWNGGDNQLTFNSHLVPTADNSYDLGSPSLKIRDIYVSDASIWIGDQHKIAIENGSMKFRKRDSSSVPSTITAAGGTSAAALTFAGKTSLSDMKLKDWEAYGKTLNISGLGIGNAKIKDIFTTNDNDYETSDNIDSKANIHNPTFTGTVTLGQAPTGDLHAATKAYVDATAGSIDTSTLAPKASPTFTGVVTLPTITNSSEATSAATKQYVDDTAGNIDTSTLAPKASPTFTGTPLAPTAAVGANDSQLATTQFVTTATSNLAPKASPVFTGASARIESTTNNSQLQLKATHSSETQQYNIFSAVSGNSSGRGLHFQNHDTGSVQMSIRSDGKVGIGTTDPQAKLDVVGNAVFKSVNAANTGGIVLMPDDNGSATDGNASGRIFFNETQNNQSNHGFSLGWNGGADNDILNWKANTFNINRHDNSVNGATVLSISRTSSHFKLNATTTIGADDEGEGFLINLGSTGTVKGGTAGASYRHGYLHGDGNKNIILLNQEDGQITIGSGNSSNGICIDTNNNVGIGTTSPAGKLSITHSGGSAATPDSNKDFCIYDHNNCGLYSKSGTSTNGTTISYGLSYYNGSSAVDVDNALVLRNYSGENRVGIGTASPSQKLDVNGTVKATAFQGDGSALTGVAKQADIDTAINGLIDSAPGTLDTLNEIAASIGDNGNFVGTVSNFADVDTVTTAPTNGQALVWNSTNLKWEPGNVAASGGGSGPTNVMGQSFFEILTQQPHKFQADGAYTSSTSHITINWKYDSISLFHDSTVVAKLCFGANAQAKSLPFISQIKIQIKSPYTSNTWIDYTTLTVTSSQDYNTTASLKTLTLPKWTGTPTGGIETTLSKAGESNKFDIRVYGINNAENYPNEATRALEYLQVFYLVPNPPSAPIWSSEVAIGSDAQISFYYKCAETENIDPNNAGDQSDAFITSAITKYVEIETLAYNNPVLTTEYTDTESVSNKNENETFLITLTGIRAGTKYKYKVQAKNNLADNYSDFSAFRNHTNYTRTPGDNSIGTSVSFGINNTSKTSIRGYIDGSSTVSGSQIYINTAASQKVTPATTSTQTIQITDPYSSTQHTTNTGYGNYVNGSTGLVTLKVTVDGTLKQTVSYGGFNTTPSQSGGNDNEYIDTVGQSDIYGITNATKGFRLKGTFALNELSNTNITTTIGAARKTAHTLKYEYDRHADVGGSDTSTTHNIYIDTLSGNPGITYTTSLVTVTSVKYTMGIASVDDMTIQIVRNYTNCNSAHGFIRGDGKVGYIGAVSKTTYGAQNWIIAANNIDVGTPPGSYTHTKTTTGVNYTQAFTGGTNDSLSETSYAYNLNGNTTGTLKNLNRGSGTSTTVLNHFHDHNSYANDTTATSKLTLSNLYEITAATISKFNTDMGAIATQAYTSHSTVPLPSTLLYINGGFRTNANFTYPNTSSMNYDSVSVNTYTTGTTAYSTAGASDTNGYKWYCQKFSMSSSYELNGNLKYLNVYGIGGLSATTMNKVKDRTDLDAIGFIQQTFGGITRIGNLGYGINTFSPWYEKDTNKGWTAFDLDFNHGSVTTKDATHWGPLLDIVNGDDDIYIFIGLKNTVSLS